jgi:hypothetical protein
MLACLPTCLPAGWSIRVYVKIGRSVPDPDQSVRDQDRSVGDQYRLFDLISNKKQKHVFFQDGRLPDAVLIPNRPVLIPNRLTIR